MTQLSLADLSTEILHNIFYFLDATDLAGVGGTCRLFHDFLKRDDLLWQRIYLSRFVSFSKRPSFSSGKFSLADTGEIARTNLEV